MLYGSETWALNERLLKVIRGSDRRMLQYMAGVNWKDRLTSKEVARCVVLITSK